VAEKDYNENASLDFRNVLPIYEPPPPPVRDGAEPKRSIRKSIKALTLGAE
jgi:hypothetical protein